MPFATGLNSPVRLAFAAGNAELNRTALRQFVADTPNLDLFVCSEFQPEIANCRWIPYHVNRSLTENKAALQAALDGRAIETAALFVSSGTALRAMRKLAVLIAGTRLSIYDSSLRAISPKGIPVWLAGVARGELQRQFSEGGRARKWLRRLARPAEAEIPVRARLAQLRGKAAAGRREDLPRPMAASEPLSRGVSVVVPSRDGRQLLQAMLQALLPQLETGEIIVVNNGSSDETREWLNQTCPALRVIESPEPLSFAKAVNAGIKAAKFDRILMLNNDMLVKPEFLTALEAAFAKIPDLFCATAQIFFPEGIRREETGKTFWRKEAPLDFPVRCEDPLPGEDLTWVLYGSGGCSLFDTKMLRELGGVSETYDPAYVEDMDFGYRAWKRGWPTVFVAGAKVEHRHRATTSRFYKAEDLDFFTERNYMRFVETAIGSKELFSRLWSEGVRRLQLQGALRTLRNLPKIGPRPPEASGLLSEPEILALSNGDAATFPGREPRMGSRKVIIASPYLPYPLSHGGAVRIYNLMLQSAPHNDLILIAFVDALRPPPAELLEICAEVILVHRHGTHFRHQTDRPDMVEEFESATFRASLKQAVWKWDAAIVQLEFTWMAQYAGKYGRASTILVEHDITFDLHRQLLATDPANWEASQQFRKWQTFETAAWNEVDCVVTMSPKDHESVNGAKSVVTIPNGVDTHRFRIQNKVADPKRLLFIGSFAHRPNVLAIEWFLSEVWPLLEGYTLHIIAGQPTNLTGPNLEVTGFVSDVRPAYERAGMVLAPLVASAGTNIKVLEAMAMEKVVVGTPAGFHGLPVRPGIDCLLATEPQQMGAAIRAGSHRDMEKAARETAESFDWSKIAEIQQANYDCMDPPQASILN